MQTVKLIALLVAVVGLLALAIWPDVPFTFRVGMFLGAMIAIHWFTLEAMRQH